MAWQSADVRGRGSPRATSALVGLLTLAVMPGAISGQRNIDCAKAYNNYLESLRHKNVPPERRTILRRWALRAYDACVTGDVPDVEGLFESLDRQKY